MAKRTPIVVGNWKLNKTIAEALALVTELKNSTASIRDVEVGVAPVATAISPVVKRLEGSSVQVYGQNCHHEDRGAFTGEVSPSLFAEAGCKGVIVGHSERRQLFGETDEGVAKKVTSVLAANLQVIACVGESEAERDSGQTESRVRTQMSAVLGAVQDDQVDGLVIAYEPVWAIGTGRTATPAQAQEVHAVIRAMLVDRFGAAGQTVRIQYGGSVKPGNAAELLRQPDIDGALVGGASLVAEDFVAIVKAARG